MKNVVLILSAAVLTTFVSCKNEKPTTIIDKPETEVIQTSEDLALVDANDLNAETSTQFLYVTAPSGLSLREFGNLQSEKIGKMPYGTKVKVIDLEENMTMNVAGIKGGMDKIEFNHKEGFAFNGYLSKYFPPERDITAKGYVSELNKFFPEVLYSETNGGSVTNPSNTQSITLPKAQWHEAFFMAQRLFDFPQEFTFPNPKGKNTEVINDGKPKKGIWVSELQITRDDNELEKIAYVYGSKQFDTQVTIVKEGDAMKISKTEVVK